MCVISSRKSLKIVKNMKNFHMLPLRNKAKNHQKMKNVHMFPPCRRRLKVIKKWKIYIYDAWSESASFFRGKKVWFFRAVIFWKRELDVLKAIISNRELQILQGKTSKRDHFIRSHIWKSFNLKSRMNEKITLVLPFSCTDAISHRASYMASHIKKA